MPLVWIIALPFVGSVLAGLMPRRQRNPESWVAGAFALGCCVLIASLYPRVASGEIIRATFKWAPALGLEFSLRMDGYAWLFAMLVSAMGALVVLYARYYMSPKDPVPRFFSFLLSFMGAMLGVVLSGNLVQMVLFWELTSLASFLLIGYWHHRVDARRGARMALTVTAMGGLCLLAGVLLIGRVVGSYDLDAVLASGDMLRNDPWYLAILLLVGLGTLTKSAQTPFHFWLPHAMAAPTPVSAYLHSATMVKTGVFLLVRLWPVLAGTEAWFWLIGGAGLGSLVLGAYAAMFQKDMKGVLAYSTISHLGLITLLLGMNSNLGLLAAIFHIANHATFKASLFMAAGIVDHETGTRDLRRLSGLRYAMPITATLATVAAAAMAGVPLLNGFISKEMFFTETVFVSGSRLTQIGLPAVAVVASMFSVAYSLRFILQVFFGPPATDLPRAPHEPPPWMLLPSALLVLACLVVGIFPQQTIGPFLDTAAKAVLGANTPAHDLAVWHGFNLPLAMSVLALAGGIVIYYGLRLHLRRLAAAVVPGYHLDGKHIYESTVQRAIDIARGLTTLLSSARLQTQLALLLAAIAGSAAWALRQHGLPEANMPLTTLDPAFALVWLVGGACAIGTAIQAKYHRLAALIMAGVAGLATTLTFAWFSAPDLALTQLAVEVVTVVLILLGLRWLPRRKIEESADIAPSLRTRGRRLRDVILASCAGLGFAALTFTVLRREPGAGISSYFIENSLPLGGGNNVINVILVDFRGFDTMGEITVLGIVALTVYALLRRFRPAEESLAKPRQQREAGAVASAADPRAPLPAGTMMLPALLVRLLLPVAGMISLFYLLRGHNLPGGGFVGGLIMATAMILQYLAGGTIWAESRTRLRPHYWIACGLLCSAGAGMSAWLATRPFLSALAWHGTLPILGEMHLSTVLLFDLGVYLLVIGAAALILVALAHQSLRRRHRLPAAARMAGMTMQPFANLPAESTPEDH
ncbi:multisubunit potassium/proton antiporter PhaA subunit /multisubunit potassium/proton antiporter PhaB subunit [Paucimonas lemoignei]|uniref:Multisubunit potassium/proton antiporter PhaA subunit /multisubunit potassium/proton antiporter PhaB subunit n=1 Tax=Paucimonas lemoignei TaxID=29443 RepID=A0A4R3HTJ4_PAULE|nr:monovalent cation/H+ antiporter subunit A [Paucimonas lemoignei]TCS36536.1 multisubunit potassium/proton antiporter PhaA subunit /multisubunit potassium/proton antiporter PhaB subunit [Paucimonas lemoignei]